MLSALSIILLMLVPTWPVSAQDPAEARIIRAAESFLSERFPEDATRLEVRLVRMSGEVPLSGAISISFPPSNTLPRAHTQVTLRTGTSAIDQAPVHATLYIAHYDSVAIAQTRVAPDAPLTEHDVTVAWMETTRTYGTPLRTTDLREMFAAGPVHARRLIREGQALRSTDVRPAYAVETGSLVLMTYDRGHIKLKLSCSAREPGGIGDLIRVYNSDTSTMYRARLTGPGTAEWTETL